MITAEILSLARQLWDYHKLGQTLQKSDAILALGSHDLRVAERAAELFIKGFAPWLILSGGLGNFTKNVWQDKEADRFAAIARKMGVPSDKILIENNSTNTGENILLTQKLLAEKRLQIQSFILVQKPYMERRSYATFKKHWPDKEVLVTSPQLSFEDYPTPEIPMDRVINIMVGDLQRIKYYPARGFQIEQFIPQKVWEACEKLIAAGFNKHLIVES